MHAVLGRHLTVINIISGQKNSSNLIYNRWLVQRQIFSGWNDTEFCIFSLQYLLKSSTASAEIGAHMSNQLYLTFCNHMDCSPPGFTVHDFFRQECWSGFHFLLQGIFPTQELDPSPVCTVSAGRFFTPVSPGKTHRDWYHLWVLVYTPFPTFWGLKSWNMIQLTGTAVTLNILILNNDKQMTPPLRQKAKN